MFQQALKQIAQGATGFANELAKSLPVLAAIGQNTKAQQEYAINGTPVGTVGPHGLWRIYAGTARSHHAVVREVSVWVLDKRELMARGGADLSTSGPGLHGPGGGHPPSAAQRWEGVFRRQRQACAAMTRLKHPGVVRVILPLEETAAHMVLVTEAVRGCLREALPLPGAQGGQGGQGGHSSSPAPSPLSPLEAKLGLLQLAEALAFVHAAAHLAHGGVSPQNVVVAADGSWKLAGLAFALPLEGGPGAGGQGQGWDPSDGPPYAYGDPFPPLHEELSRPQLAYSAPELVAPPGGAAPWGLYGSSLGPGGPGSLAAADAFSLGALVWEAALACSAAALEAGGAGALSGDWGHGGGGGQGGQGGGEGSPFQLLPVRCSVQAYGARVAALAALTGGGAGGGGAGPGPLAAEAARLPAELRGPLLSLLSPQPSLRPSPAALASWGWFEADPSLRALRFLEGMMQAEPRHKLAFLADFGVGRTTGGAAGGGAEGAAPGAAASAPGEPRSPPWAALSDRLLAGRELRGGGPVAAAALPVALGVCGRLGRTAFAALALPALGPLMEAAGGGATGGGGGVVGAGAGGGGGGAGAGGSDAALLGALVAQAEALAALMDGPTQDRLLLPLLLRAVTGTDGAGAGAGAGPAPSDPRVALAALAALQRLLAGGLLDARSKQVYSRLLPGLRGAVGRTTSAGVRAAGLGLMAAVADKVDRSEGEALVATCTQLLAVDPSGGTLLAVAGLAEALARAPAWGPAAAAGRLLPLLTPQLLAPGLSGAQLAGLAGAVQRMLTRVVRAAEEAAASRAEGGAAAAGGAAGLAAGLGLGAGPQAQGAVPAAAGGASWSSAGRPEASGASGSGGSGAVAVTTWTGGPGTKGGLGAGTGAPAAAPAAPAASTSHASHTAGSASYAWPAPTSAPAPAPAVPSAPTPAATMRGAGSAAAGMGAGGSSGWGGLGGGQNTVPGAAAGSANGNGYPGSGGVGVAGGAAQGLGAVPTAPSPPHATQSSGWGLSSSAVGAGGGGGGWSQAPTAPATAGPQGPVPAGAGAIARTAPRDPRDPFAGSDAVAGPAASGGAGGYGGFGGSGAGSGHEWPARSGAAGLSGLAAGTGGGGGGGGMASWAQGPAGGGAWGAQAGQQGLGAGARSSAGTGTPGGGGGAGGAGAKAGPVNLMDL
ncbi:hypothetical protein HYH03_003787 [Edaphochlamys debaryana]|uniref:Protein kinase domain-containing protein n=1 Tax=Edaphochlamys debaryana TaxID=47281 RepID=A0A836C2H9_9CHLO|nr:hypothetical protein HYH03_003787 [Edaphochlamys debaryana]|eukprot:KAG2498026.1 hypothetical protein HYH03_003787 [Edaphochlamys debaryana]